MKRSEIFIGTANSICITQFAGSLPWQPIVNYEMPFGLTPPQGFLGISFGSANISCATISNAGVHYIVEAHAFRYELNPKPNEPYINIDTYQADISPNGYAEIYKNPFTTFHWPSSEDQIIKLLPNESRYAILGILRNRH